MGNVDRTASRTVIPQSRGLRLLPIFVALPYLFITWGLFLVGPYVWPVRQWWAIYALIPAAFLALGMGFVVGTRGQAQASGMPAAKAMFWIGGLAALALLVPSSLVYTGKLPWQLSGALESQKDAYSALAEQLAATQGSRGPIALARALFGPLTFCVVPIVVVLWESATKLEKTLAFGTVAASVIFSIERGTTSQLADVFIVGLSAFLVRVGIFTGNLAGLARHWRALVGAAVAFSIILVVVVGRTEARLGGQNIRCLANSGVCADLSSGVYGRMGDTVAFGSAAVTGYFSQGYYGVALAAEKDWEPTWGIGHSPVASALFVMLGGSESFANRSFTFRARSDGWSDETQWSSLITWLANDLTLWGSIVALFGLGWLWGKSWLDASAGGDLRGTVLFCVLSLMVFYLPANNYLMSTYEGYTTLVFWLAVWGFRRRRRSAPSFSEDRS